MLRGPTYLITAYMIYIAFEIIFKRTAWSNIKHIKMTSFLVGGGGGEGSFLRIDVSQGNDVCPWISCATLYMVMVHGQSASFYCSRAEVEPAVKPRKRKSGNKVFSSLNCGAPQKHCTDLKIKTSTSSDTRGTTALRQPSGFQLASKVIYSTKKSAGKHCTKRIQRLLTCKYLRVISRWFSSRWCLVQNGDF